MPDAGTGDSSGASSAGGRGGEGGEGTYGAEDQREGDAGEESERDGQMVENIPDDIPVDGSGDDIVGRQIREAAIAMQEVDPKAAEALWDEYRKHTGIK
jgi:hypothetical protein